MNLPGVYTAQKKDGTLYYRASFTYKNKHISLGSFPEERQAHEAYCEALSLIEAPFTDIDHFPKKGHLSFEKWVSIINFRDNGLYFSTPIYVYPKYFYYYLSRQIRLTFDIDDLFFYSSHKIMQRKGHLFVADYGMQLNIVNRYGIKNYAVLGKDYRFINGDCHDFRYENIEILNVYQGVSQVTHRGKKIPCTNPCTRKLYCRLL